METQKEIHNIIGTQLEQLPENVRLYIESKVWDTALEELLIKDVITHKYSEEIKYEIFFYLLGLRDKNETIKKIQDIPEETESLNKNIDFFSVIPDTIQKELADILSPEETPVSDERLGGVEITHESQTKNEEDIVPERENVMQGIEHPENITSQSETISNPIGSKLKKTTESSTVPLGDNPSRRGYAEGQDPYREALN